jgi:hypothetical protein
MNVVTVCNGLSAQARVILENCYNEMAGSPRGSKHEYSPTHLEIDGDNVIFKGAWHPLGTGLPVAFHIPQLLRAGLIVARPEGGFVPTEAGYAVGEYSAKLALSTIKNRA